MTDILKQFIEVIKDKTTSIGFKTALFFSIVGVIFLADYLIGFSYNYHLNNKLEQIEKLELLKKNYENDTIRLDRILLLEKDIWERRHYSDLFNDIISQESEIEPTYLDTLQRSLFWMFVTSNYGLIIAFFMLLFLPFRASIHRTGENLLGLFAMLVILGFIMWFLTWLAYVFPLLWDKPYLNYILNVVLHIPIAYFIYWFVKGK